jgi:hypothetical protein
LSERGQKRITDSELRVHLAAHDLVENAGILLSEAYEIVSAHGLNSSALLREAQSLALRKEKLMRHY